MSVINPNKVPRILVDDFIRLAKDHLLTVEGTAICATTYVTSAGVPTIGFAKWKGYQSVPEMEMDTTDIPNLPNTSTSFKPSEITSNLVETPDDLEAELAALRGGTNIRPTEKTAEGKDVPNYGSTPSTNFVASNADARKAAEAYLGRSMTDTEWNDLVSITYAEATSNQTERAWVMAVILNRTRIGYTPRGVRNPKYRFDTITDIINQPYQFQPVTGTRIAPGPSDSYLNGLSRFPNQAISIYGAAKNILKDVPKGYTAFTSNNPAAYGPGTNINYLYNLRAKPTSKIIGGTIFGF
jgi:hypothetical protein